MNKYFGCLFMRDFHLSTATVNTIDYNRDDSKLRHTQLQDSFSPVAVSLINRGFRLWKWTKATQKNSYNKHILAEENI